MHLVAVRMGEDPVDVEVAELRERQLTRQRVDDMEAARAALEAKGVTFAGETFDTGACHMAFFTDPDGNDLMLHHRYKPRD